MIADNTRLLGQDDNDQWQPLRIGQAAIASSLSVVMASGQELAVTLGETIATQEAARTLTTVTGTAASSGDNTLVAAPGASTRIVVCGITLQNESSTETTMILKTGSTAKRRVLGQNQGDGVYWQFGPGREWRLGTNEALVLNLSGANTCGYTVDYWTEAV